MAKFSRCLVPFGTIALVTGENEIARTIGAAAAARHLVVEFKGHPLLATIGTRVVIFDEEIGAQFPPRKLAVLVIHACDFRILDELHVETDPLNLDPAQRGKAAGPSRPAYHIVHTGAD
jgi:hypothetical protein